MREGKIRWRENRRLRILNIQALNLRQVTNRAANHHITFVFDRPCLGTVAYAQIAVLGICPKWDKQNIHVIKRHQTRKLWELNIIANQDTDTTSIGVKYFDLIATFNHPRATLMWGNVDFALLFDRTVTAAQITHVI